MREWLIEHLKFPQRTVLEKKVPKKAFFTQADLTPSEKDLFTSQIEGIYLLSLMNQQSVNIPAHLTEEIHYAEVIWIYVQLRTSPNAHKIVKAMHRAMPNPIVLIAESPDKQLILSTCHKRLNKNNMTKIVADEPVLTRWFDPLDHSSAYLKLVEAISFPNLSFGNLFTLYDDVHNWLQTEVLITKIGTLPSSPDNLDKINHMLSQIKNDESEINKLQQEQKKQLDFGEKMELHMTIKRLEQQVTLKLEEIKELY